MWSFPDVTGRGFTPGGVLLENPSESYFLQAQHRFAPGCSAFARYDAFFANIDDHDGSNRPASHGTASSPRT